MSTTSFKRKKYGMVKPVKERKTKAKRPDVREIKRIYVAIAKRGVWQQLDSVCYAMQWWITVLAWFKAETSEMTTSQARRIARALEHRKQGLAANDDKKKIAKFIDAIKELESLTDLNAPKIRKYIFEGEKTEKKHAEILTNMAPKFERITGVMAKMFPSCPLSIVVVPQIIDPVTGKDIGRKIDHSKDTIYYSRKQMKAMRVVWRKQGILALAIEEAWWLSRAMSFVHQNDDMRLVDSSHHLNYYGKLMEDFEEWARRKDTPRTLARKPRPTYSATKPKKERELQEMAENDERQRADADYFDELEEVDLDAEEEALLSGEIASMEKM